MKKLYIQRDRNCEIIHYQNYADISKDQYQVLLIQYLKKTKPDKLKFNPTFIEVIDGRLRFGMAKHYGVLSVDLNIILNVFA